ncbi:MAG: hypothetical protein HYS57_01185, partial [Parcubacteria group bacterium]|nr:hypothetical protein [Parcubacteria group bacterium]
GGTNELHAHTFSITAEKGEGLTHIARKLVHDFLVEQKDLGGEAGLSKAQIVYAEDLLRRQLEGTVEPGETFQIGGAQIAGVVERAKNLTELQVKNIETRWVPRIDGSTWKKILDYSTNYGKENNVSDAVIQRAKEAATAKAQAAAEEAGRALSEAPPVVSPQAVLAKDAWFKGVWVAYLGAGMVAGGVGALGYKYRGVLKEKVARTIERLEKNLFAEDSGVEIEKEVESGALENDVSPEREEGEGAVPKETVPKDTAKGKKGFFARKAEEKRAAEEVRRTREREKEESRRASEREKEEAEKRFAVDPLVRFLASKGKKVTLGEVTYRGLVPEDIGKEQAGNVSFEDYSTFRRYVDGLTLWQRVKMRMYHDHEHNRSFGIFAPPEFWGELKKDPELEREFFEVQDRALRGLLPDEYGGIPANKEVTKETVDALRSSISEEFRKETGSRRSLSVYASNLSVFPEETYEGLLKLREALKDIPKDVQISLVEEASGIVSLGRENRLDGWGSIEIQPGLTVQEMVVFLKKVIPESVRRRKEALERDRAKL